MAEALRLGNGRYTPIDHYEGLTADATLPHLYDRVFTHTAKRVRDFLVL